MASNTLPSIVIPFDFVEARSQELLDLAHELRNNLRHANKRCFQKLPKQERSATLHKRVDM